MPKRTTTTFVTTSDEGKTAIGQGRKRDSNDLTEYFSGGSVVIQCDKVS